MVLFVNYTILSGHVLQTLDSQFRYGSVSSERTVSARSTWSDFQVQASRLQKFDDLVTVLLSIDEQEKQT